MSNISHIRKNYINHDSQQFKHTINHMAQDLLNMQHVYICVRFIQGCIMLKRSEDFKPLVKRHLQFVFTRLF